MRYLATLLILLCSLSRAEPVPWQPILPEFTSGSPKAWFNSPPLSRYYLLGKVVLIEIWTFDSGSCYRTIPWLKSLEKRFSGEGFQLIGIHTPRYLREKQRDNVAARIHKYKLHYPVMMDNKYRYWHALGNRFWPAYYLVDRQGRIRYQHTGEIHEDTPEAAVIEKEIRQLLDERG